MPLFKNILILSAILNSLISSAQTESEEILEEASSDDYSVVRNIESFSIIRNNDKYGLLNNENNTVVIPLEYNNIRIALDNPYLFRASKMETETYIKEALNQKYESTRRVSKEVLINEKGEMVSKKYFSIKEFQENKLVVVEFLHGDSKYQTLIDIEGNEIANTYDHIQFDNKLNLYAAKEKDGKAGLLSLELKKVIPFEYDDAQINSYNEPAIVVKKNRKYGVVDINNKIIVPLQYDRIKSHFDDKYIVVQNGKQYLINSQRKFVFPEGYDRIYNPDDNGNHIVKDNGSYGMVNGNGKVLIPVLHQKIYVEKIFGYYVPTKDKLYGVYDKEEELVPVAYDELILLTKKESLLETIDYRIINRLIAVKNGKYGVIDLKNNTIIPFDFEFIRFATQKKHFEKKVRSSSLAPEDYIYELFVKEGRSYLVNDKNVEIQVR